MLRHLLLLHSPLLFHTESGVKLLIKLCVYADFGFIHGRDLYGMDYGESGC
jgi:hypothetical protein